MGYGANICSVIDGELIRVSSGNDEDLVSTIAIYDAEYDRTVVYLHLVPNPNLKVGSQIHRGDYLGTESSRGADAVHTHIEVVNGRTYYANLSVDDYYLDNEPPYRYWAVRLSQDIIRDGAYYYAAAMGLPTAGLTAPENPMPLELVKSVMYAPTGRASGYFVIPMTAQELSGVLDRTASAGKKQLPQRTGKTLQKGYHGLLAGNGE